MIGGKSQSRTKPTALGTMLNASTYGATIPTIFGTVKSPLLVIWAAKLRKGGSGKKGKLAKKKGAPPTYVENCDFLIGSNPIEGCLQAWLNNNRYPLNFVRYDTTIPAGGTVTIPDANFYFVVGVTAEVSLSGTFNDYGGQGSQAWGPTVYEYPLWNAANHGPDLVDASVARWWPWVFKWVSADGATVTFPFIQALLAPSYGLPNANGNLHIYYAQLSASSHTQVPITLNRMAFESKLGSGSEYSNAGLSSQQIIYPYYAGLGSSNMDLGVTGLLPDTRIEGKCSHALYSRGDADFFDMIEDVLKSGMLQVGSQVGQIHRGVNLNDLPGPVQKNLFRQLEPFNSVPLRYNQANNAGDILIGFCSWRIAAAGTNPTIGDTAGNTWTPIFQTGSQLNGGMRYPSALASAAGNVVTFNYHGGGTGYGSHASILQIGSGSTSVDATNSATGSTSAAQTVSCSITTSGPAYIVAMFDTQANV